MNRLPGLDLLRTLAIVWVMLFHSFVVGGLGEGYQWLSDYGWMGVDLFFVLSGYLIGSQVLKPLSRGQSPGFGDFYLRRVFRVVPAFLVVVALYAWWPAFREAEGLQPVWQFLTFTVNLLIDYKHNKAFSHAWSLCVEEHFYLVFPWLAWWLTRRSSMSKFIGVSLGLLAAGMALRGYVWVHDLAPAREMEGLERGFGLRYIEEIYYPTWMRLDGLLAGVVLATVKAYRPSWWERMQNRSNLLLLGGLLVVAASIWMFRERFDLLPTVVGYPLLSIGLALLVVAGAGNQSIIGRWRVPGAGWLALISYSLYLTHKAAMHLTESWFGAQLEGHGLLAFVVYGAAVLLMGALLHYSVEGPFLRLRERLLLRRKNIAAVPEF
jgi:peptidoglycan/LPS O-acetylase OafA/YrhL